MWKNEDDPSNRELAAFGLKLATFLVILYLAANRLWRR